VRSIEVVELGRIYHPPKGIAQEVGRKLEKSIEKIEGGLLVILERCREEVKVAIEVLTILQAGKRVGSRGSCSGLESGPP
jgi:hypothetical protein